MSSMTESFTRMAEVMAEGHRQRSELRLRLREMAGERHAEMGAQLSRMNAARADASRAQRRAAAEGCDMRRRNMAEMMRMFQNAMDARRQLRLDMIPAARASAAEFMQSLTDNVAAMREEFDAGTRERIGACQDAGRTMHGKLAAFAEDRRGARMAFGGARSLPPGGGGAP